MTAGASMCCFMRSCGAMGLKENVVYALGTLLHCRLKLLSPMSGLCSLTLITGCTSSLVRERVKY